MDTKISPHSVRTALRSISPKRVVLPQGNLVLSEPMRVLRPPAKIIIPNSEIMNLSPITYVRHSLYAIPASQVRIIS